MESETMGKEGLFYYMYYFKNVHASVRACACMCDNFQELVLSLYHLNSGD